MLPKILNYFYEISKIPRKSKNEAKIKEYLINWAINKGLEYRTDKIGNVVIIVPATSEKINNEIIVLQAHLDMVCVQQENKIFDFATDSIEIIEKDGWLSANGTTLGADNGVGIAMMMASTDLLSHPKLELLYTVDEEQGLGGALNFDPNIISGKKIINLDTEDEGQICVSCAGGARILISQEVLSTKGKFPQYNIKFSGMKGGHSGVDIGENRGNALLLMLEFLNNLDMKWEMISLHGGFADNAIPAQSEMIIGIENIGLLEDKIQKFISKQKLIYDCPDLNYQIINLDTPEDIIENSQEIIKNILQFKVGIYTMSTQIDGLVQTSANLGILKINSQEILGEYLARSSIREELHNLVDEFKIYFNKNNFKIEIKSMYYGWQADIYTPFVKIIKNSFEKIFGEAKILAIHAGLECGILVDKLGVGAEAISIGPSMHNVHSTSEKVQISSIEKTSQVLEEILRNC